MNYSFSTGNRGKATSFFDPSHDSSMAGNLAKILKQAGQEVPEWLSSGNFASGEADSFGGRDIRGVSKIYFRFVQK